MSMMEVDVPAGVGPNQYFTVQTPDGAFVQVKAPPGERRLRFQVPNGGATGLPTLLGAEEGAAGLPTAQAYPTTAPVVQGYRIDPKDATLNNVPLLKGLPENKAERKLHEIHKGSELMRANPPFPDRRKWQDACWIVPFVALVGAMIALAIIYGRMVEADADFVVDDGSYDYWQDQPGIPGDGSAGHGSGDVDRSAGVSLKDVVVPGVVGGAASTVASFFYFLLVQWQPGCIVWTSLLLSPTLLILGGLALLFAGSVIGGLISIAGGALYLCLIFCYYITLVPFMIKLVEVIAKVTRQHKSLIVVAVVGAIFGLAWSILCGIAFYGAYQHYDKQLEDSSSAQVYGVIFVAVLIFVWGAQVAYAVCHVTYCGVFGRWYFNKTGGVCASLRVALTTSFGSICFGSFIIAVVRAVEATVRSARNRAAQEGNVCLCVILLVLECVVSCIGDFLEYFSEWAYVQCAVRGVNFIDAARITYSMMTCANIEFILRDLLLNSVVTLGALMCGLVGAAVGAGMGYVMGDTRWGHNTDAIVIGAVIGLWAGLLAGGSAAGIISSGTKTILALWAEDPEPLRLSHPETHDDFEARIVSRYNEYQG